MSLTLLSNLQPYEVSFVPRGKNNKKFLITKENGEIEMDELLKALQASGGLKDVAKFEAVIKEFSLGEKEQAALKGILTLTDSAGISSDVFTKVLKGMDKLKMTDLDPSELEKIKKMCKDELHKEFQEKEKSFKEKITKELLEESSKMVPVKKEDGSWDLSTVDEKLKPALEVVFKSNEQLEKTNKTLADELRVERDLRITKEFNQKAIAMGYAGDEAASVAKSLKDTYSISKEAGESLEKVLKSAADKVKESEVFKEFGTTGGHQPNSAWEKIEKSAETIRATMPNLSQEQAIDLVMKNNPALYAEYEKNA